MRDPIIDIMSKMICEKCGTKTVYCDCWVLELLNNEENLPCYDRENETKEYQMTDHVEPVVQEETLSNEPQTFDVVLTHCYNEFNRMIDFLHVGLQKGAGEVEIIAKDALKSHVLLNFTTRAMQETGLISKSANTPAEVAAELEKKCGTCCEDVIVPLIEKGLEAAVPVLEDAIL